MAPPTALRSFCEGVPALADVMAMALPTAEAVQHAVVAEIGCRVVPDPGAKETNHDDTD